MARKIIAPESKMSGMTLEENREKNSDVMTHSHRNALLRAEQRQTFVSIPERYAESNFFHRNYLYKDAHKLYPDSLMADYRFVDKCYPYAKGGMLLVDEPRSELALKRAKEKHEHLKRMGFRHVIYEDNMTLLDLEQQEADYGVVNRNQGLENQAE